VAYELPIPDYLNENEETIHQRMLEKAPPGIDTSEGSFFWDATRPGAIEKAQLVQFTLQNLLQIFFVQTSHGQYLDYLGQVKGVTRLPATPSTGKVKFAGQPGTLIKVGTRISTQSSANSPAIIFETTESGVINEQGEVTVSVACTEAGTIGNVPAGTIVLMVEPVEGVTSVTNPEPFTGGTDIEDDDAFRERILAAYDEPLSGAKKDYIRWAREVPGVGDAKVFPLWNGPGTVKVVIIDGNKRAANSELLDAVTTHIEERRPIGAEVTVASATEKQINITANVSLAIGYTIAQVQQLYEEAVINFLKQIALVETYVSYAQLGKILLETAGVGDYSNLLVNGAVNNVLLGEEEMPVLGTVILEVME
jgi:uncharacterized phage protein gp47/JayE